MNHLEYIYDKFVFWDIKTDFLFCCFLWEQSMLEGTCRKQSNLREFQLAEGTNIQHTHTKLNYNKNNNTPYICTRKHTMCPCYVLGRFFRGSKHKVNNSTFIYFMGPKLDTAG